MLDQSEVASIGVYTTAPEAYDGFGTLTLQDRVGETYRGVAVRLALVAPRYLEWQTCRYSSGLHLAATEDRWREMLDMGIAREDL